MHTPTPWTRHDVDRNLIVPLGHEKRPIGGAADANVDRQRFAQVIAEIRGRHTREKEETEGNGELILRAVNVHKALVEALKAAMEAMNHMGDVLNDMDAVEEEDEKFFSAFDQVRTALALADQP